MGQKVKPRTYRLGVPYDNTTLLMSVNARVPTKDRRGHKNFLGFSKHQGEYGHQLNVARRFSKHREEMLLHLGLLTNRLQVQVRQGHLRAKRDIYQPVRTNVNKEVSEDSEIKKLNISQLVDIERVHVARDRITKMLQDYFKSEVDIDVVNRNAKLNNDNCLSIVEKRCANETKLRETIVSQEGRAGALVLNARQPSAERLSKVVARQLEDSLKHSDVRTQRREMMNVMDGSDRGRVDYATIMSGKVDNRNGGYRGYRVMTKGTIDGSRRTRKEVIANGVRPLSTITSPISYGYKQAKTKTGTRGVHVMYCY